MKIISFSYRDGPRPEGGIPVIDCTKMRNPHNVIRLRLLTGKRKDVQDYVRVDHTFTALLTEAERLLCINQVVAFGCYGGRHRSVAMAELLAERITLAGGSVQIQHLALDRGHGTAA